MTLEDQIRRMGEARAAEVHTPSWSNRLGTGARRWPLLIAAAAVVAIVVGGVVFFTGDDAADTETADTSDSRSRWIPASGVERIDYPGELGIFAGWLYWPEVALLTPDGRIDVADEDVTRVLGGSSWSRKNSFPADGFRVSVRDDGIVELDLTRTDDELSVASIETGRFSADELERRAPELLDLSNDMAALADAIVGWDQALVVAYLGEIVPIEAVLAADGTYDDAVFWLATASTAQFVASYGTTGSIDYFRELLALEDTEDFTLTEEYFGYVGNGPTVKVDESEWLAIVDDVLGPDPEVNFPGSELSATAPGAPVLARPAADAFTTGNGHWTVRLLYPEPTSFRDGVGVVVTVGGVTLTFGPMDPGVEFTTLAVPARLAEAEARRYADLINAAMAEPAPPTEPYPTVEPTQTGICAANPLPGDDVLDVATHIAFDRSPLDLDQDGVDDEMLVYDDDDGNWWLIARLRGGWTNALGIGTPPTPPALAQTSGAVPAGTDLDGDGGLEFFLTGYLGPSAAMVTARGCELVDEFFLDEPAEGIGASFGVQIGLSPDMPLCQGRACATRVRCAAGVLTQELFVGVGANDDPGYWTTAELRLDPSGVITSTELPNRPVGPFDELDDPPTEVTTGVIDCAP